MSQNKKTSRLIKIALLTLHFLLIRPTCALSQLIISMENVEAQMRLDSTKNSTLTVKIKLTNNGNQNVFIPIFFEDTTFMFRQNIDLIFLSIGAVNPGGYSIPGHYVLKFYELSPNKSFVYELNRPFSFANLKSTDNLHVTFDFATTKDLPKHVRKNISNLQMSYWEYIKFCKHVSVLSTIIIENE